MFEYTRVLAAGFIKKIGPEIDLPGQVICLESLARFAQSLLLEDRELELSLLGVDSPDLISLDLVSLDLVSLDLVSLDLVSLDLASLSLLLSEADFSSE
jgi:hypothetical protein